MDSTVGKMKIEEMKTRLVDINPRCNVTLVHDFVSNALALNSCIRAPTHNQTYLDKDHN
jgi:tRNA A37 threonylcarbamoyladenosine dehydratase